MWFILSIIALFCWAGSDIFSKIGSGQNDRLSHWKMVIAVGIVMGIHAAFEIFIGKVPISLSDILVYLPASSMYILSMIFGYVSLRYIELSISSPICNSSGALAAVLCMVFLNTSHDFPIVLSIALIAIGIVSLGFVNMSEDSELKKLRQKDAKYKYSKSFIALLLPVLYCIIDALGTFIDCFILREESTGSFLDGIFVKTLSEETANVAYELTFLFMAAVAAVYVFIIKKEKVSVKKDGQKLLGGVCETAGQFAYIFAIGDTEHCAPAAAIISAYCVLSVILGRIFLKEKLSAKHYISIAVTATGIILLGMLDV